MTTFDDLVSEALAAPFTGWDFSWLDWPQLRTERLPWSYRREVAQRAAKTDVMLDMGTGGGERLSRLSPRPRRTVATEAWPPNVPVAAERLRPAGIPVVQDEGATDNMAQAGNDRGRLPFGDGAFGLVANRHEAFVAGEVSRVLAPGGAFVTQQVDYHSSDDLYRLLGLAVPEQPDTWLPLARQQAQHAGLTVQAAVRGAERHQFRDVGALVYYLRAVSWAVPEYSLDRCGAALRAAHDTPELWPAAFRQRLFLLVATKP